MEESIMHLYPLPVLLAKESQLRVTTDRDHTTKVHPLGIFRDGAGVHSLALETNWPNIPGTGKPGLCVDAAHGK